MQDIKKCIDILVSLQTASGNFPCAMDELGSNQRLERDELVHWCHGAPGNQLYLLIIWTKYFPDIAIYLILVFTIFILKNFAIIFV